MVLAGVAVGALPRQRFGPLAWCALGLLAAFVVWTALSLVWTESAEKTAADLARVATYLGVFVLASVARAPRGRRRLLPAMGAGIAVVAIVGLLSRLHPAWFPEAVDTARILADATTGSPSRSTTGTGWRHWSRSGCRCCSSSPAASARWPCARSAAAAVPALLLTVYFTISRGGIGASCVAVAVYLAFASDRLPKMPDDARSPRRAERILIAAASQRDALQERPETRPPPAGRRDAAG